MLTLFYTEKKYISQCKFIYERLIDNNMFNDILKKNENVYIISGDLYLLKIEDLCSKNIISSQYIYSRDAHSIDIFLDRIDNDNLRLKKYTKGASTNVYSKSDPELIVTLLFVDFIDIENAPTIRTFLER
jgi:hypothetical protein